MSASSTKESGANHSVDSMAILLLIVFLLFSFPSHDSLAQIHPSTQSISYTTPHELIVRLHASASQADFQALNERFGAVSVEPICSPATRTGQGAKLRRTYLVRLPSGWDVASIREKYARSRIVEAVAPNRLSRSLGEQILPNDPRFLEQWNLQNINMPAAWAIERGDPRIIIAVVDSGIDLTHEDLRAQLWQNVREIPNNGRDDDNNGYVDDINGWDFSDAPTLPGHGDYTDRDNDPSDETGHGTHVSGILAASANNGIGVAGIAWGCRIMPLRAGFVVATGSAFLQNDDVSAAIVYAADNGAKAINMSWGDTVDAFVIHDAVEYAYHRGCVLVGAAGNSHAVGALYPAALKTVIAVAATAQNNALSFVSNFGASIDIAAPGEAILSTQHDSNYGLLAGTSMAAPHVSGVAALLLSYRPDLSNEDIRRTLAATATPIPSDRLVGAGVINAEAALTSVGDLTAEIVAPAHFDGGDPEIAIMGTAAGSGFLTYRLEFGRTEVPNWWFPIDELQQGQKFSSILGRWETSQLEEGIYTIRLTVVGENRTTIRDKVVVWIDHSPPEISEHRAELWLSRNRFDTVISWNTDDLADGEIAFSDRLDTKIGTATPCRRHLVNLSDAAIPPGTHEYRLSVRNRTGMVTQDRLCSLRVTEERILPHRLRLETTHPVPLHVAGITDLNRNGRSELLAMPIGGAGYAATQFLERDDSGAYDSIFSTTEAFLPWATGDTDGDGLIEILGNNNERTFLVEQRAVGEFPTEFIWEVEGLWGGQLEDLDGDGRLEIISRHSATNAIWLHEAIGDNRYRRTGILENPSEGDNGIGTTFAIGDFDGDGRKEIMAGDREGDLFIYEAAGDDMYRQTWIGKIEASNAHHLAAGDLGFDDIPEFAVGGQSASSQFDIPEQHWIFVIFKSVGDNSFEAVWTQRIRKAQSGGNGLAIADAANHGFNQLAIAVWPNFYLIEYTGAGYMPIWHHSASSTFRPIVADVDKDGQNELMFNDADTFTVFGASTDRNSLTTPWGVAAIPINATSIRLEWQDFPNDSYTVYKGISKNALEVHKRGIPQPPLMNESVPRISFIDDRLQQGQRYWYAVAASDAAGNLSDSSQPVSVTPTAPPRLLAAEHAHPDRLLLHFDKQMGNSAAQASYYCLSESDIAPFHHPRSALLDRSGQRVAVVFEAGILRPLRVYEIRAENLRDASGTLIAADANALTLTVPQPSQIRNLSAAIVYPNPVRGARVIFDRLPANAEIQIYDAAGSRIAFLLLTPNDQGQKIWNLRQSNQVISSSTYVYVLEANGERRTGMLSVLR